MNPDIQANSNANIRLPARLDRWLRLVVVTPNMHKTHHSRWQIETDSNYSNLFSFWDRLFGTYTAEVDFEHLFYGLDHLDNPQKQTFHGLMALPFVRVAAVSEPSVERQTEPRGSQNEP